MKKIITITLTLLMTAAMFTACSSKKGDKEPTPPATDTPTQENQDTTKAEPKLSEIVDAVKKVYGEQYLPNQPISDEIFTSVYEMNMENIEEFYGEEPLISTHVDRFFAIKAKEGKGAEVEANVTAYRDKLVGDTMQYPMNLPRIAASQVVRHGDYVFFVMLGGFPENETEMSEEDMAKFAKEETQKGVDEINKFFK